MITKNDCMLLLYDLEEKGVDTKEILLKAVKSKDVSIEVLKFINDNRQLYLSKFYEKLRRSYNDKKSSLYINIVKEIEEPTSVLTTLSAMLTQLLLFSKNVEDKDMFLRHARAYDISRVLSMYFKSYELTACIKLLKVIKADLKALESIK